ncbi:hypothetical protein V1477_001095 [Vespula maculifrons]|uniref:Uncharacterized protein n=1 Tax=Vespula maculifrons TaxID=7453 RepID=A0ABD2D0Y3_VESMC
MYLYWLDSIAIHIRSRTSGLHVSRGVRACLVGWLVGWLAGWLVGWLVSWLLGWLVGCLLACLFAWLPACLNLLEVVPSSMMNDAGTKERLMGLCIIDSGSRTSMTVTRFTVCNGYANAISLVGMASNRLDR